MCTTPLQQSRPSGHAGAADDERLGASTIEPLECRDRIAAREFVNVMCIE